jgi:hypothetical protein
MECGSKPRLTPGMVLLNNVIANPGNCAVLHVSGRDVAGLKFVTGVAVTLSVHSHRRMRTRSSFNRRRKTL